MNNHRSLLAVFAHPDDETFGIGGTLAKYAAEGVDVSLICATRGEEGENHSGEAIDSERLGEVREQELRCAASILGVQNLFFLGYRDSGMMGTAANANLRCLHQAARDEVAGRIAELMKALRPQVVVTFDPTGGYGHPDHIAIHHATVQAVEQLAEAEQPHKLYWPAFPRHLFAKMAEYLKARGIDLAQFGDFNPDELGTPDEDVTTTIDVAAFWDIKQRAFQCHRTQLNPQSPFFMIPQEEMREGMSKEYFQLVRSRVSVSEGPEGMEGDLFAGLDFREAAGWLRPNR